MRDPRFARLADILVNYSVGVKKDQLVRINGRWKIQYLIDTRRRVGCE